MAYHREPPPLDAPDPVWRSYLVDQISHLHDCFEARIKALGDAQDARRAEMHEQNQAALKQVLDGLSEVKAIASSAYVWTSDEQKRREAEAQRESGRKEERERWLRWWRRIEKVGQKASDWGIKFSIGAAALYLADHIPW